YSFNVPLNDQLDIQWYRDGILIEGAISSTIHSDVPGHYSVIHNEYENDTLDIAYLRLDSTFTMFLLDQEYKICPGENKPILSAINGYDGDYEYKWFSVERGLESDWNNPYHTAENGGNYYFTATNCNEYTYISDTVFVHESPLTQPYFDYQNRPTLCEGDTLFVSGAEQAVTFQWRVEREDVENYNKPYIIPTTENSGDDIYLTIFDGYGCDLSTSTTIGSVYKTPFLSQEDLTQFICSDVDFIGLWLPGEYGAEFDWEGEKNGSLNPIGAGTYPIRVTNGVCPDFTGEVDVRLFDPFPAYKEVIYVLIGDTLKIPIDPSQPPGFWNSTVKIDDTESFLYVTSDQEDILFPAITYSQQCYLELNFEVRFVEEILGLDDQNNLNIYPNPAKSYIIIDTKNLEFNSLSLIDLQGKQYLETQINGSGKSLITLPGNLTKGTYLINLFQTNGDILSRKIMVE
ncbi:MAG: T9SS type A sorting domain-containing protein, partial [Cyclobacteriaceae bacterium]